MGEHSAAEIKRASVESAHGGQAIDHHCRKVRVFATIALVNALEQEKAKGWVGCSGVQADGGFGARR
ncbi:MAG: hypothetical protein Q8Q26_02690 [Pseudorhodobacter sp.]|nr:hypothetical protein [Pseudorhodobacter sp.]